MNIRIIALILFFLLFFLSYLTEGFLSSTFIVTSFLIILAMIITNWQKMLSLERDILVKFKIEYNGQKRINDGLKGILIAGILIVLVLLLSSNIDHVSTGNSQFPNVDVIWIFVILINVSNIVYHYKFYSCVLTKEGLFSTKDFKQLPLNQYDDYHYEVKHNSFILSKDGVETMELIPKTPIEPYADVLIDLLDNGIEYEV